MSIQKILFFISVFFILNGHCIAGSLSEGDRQVLSSFWQYAEKNKLAELPVQKRVSFIGKFFLNKPYQAGTLEVVKEDLPVINLRELDCVTLVEYSLALAFLDKYNDESIDQFIKNIVRLRYRNGEIVDYVSRLHYSSDWLYEMGQCHYLTDVTKSLGGMKYLPNVYFMTKNYLKYPVLAKDTHLISEMKKIETAINKRAYYYIPKGHISSITDKIKEGDIILITTNIKGLDTSHLGIALKKGKITYLMHASSSGKKVVVTSVPLEEYMAGIASQTGMMVGRVQDMRTEGLIALPE